MKVRLCKNSPKGKNRFARELAASFPQLDVKVTGCVKRCKVCRERPFAVVDGFSVDAESWEELKRTLEKLL